MSGHTLLVKFFCRNKMEKCDGLEYSNPPIHLTCFQRDTKQMKIWYSRDIHYSNESDASLVLWLLRWKQSPVWAAVAVMNHPQPMSYSCFLRKYSDLCWRHCCVRYSVWLSGWWICVTLGMSIVKGLRKCRVEFGANWKSDTIYKQSLNKQGERHSTFWEVVGSTRLLQGGTGHTHTHTDKRVRQSMSFTCDQYWSIPPSVGKCEWTAVKYLPWLMSSFFLQYFWFCFYLHIR